MSNPLSRRDFLAAASFLKALPGYRYEFPRDHFSHPGFQTEWWYYTGNLTSTEGRPFGFELTFFRQALEPDVEIKSVWTTRDVWMAHLALTDIAGKQFFHAERLNRSGPGIAGADLKAQRIWNGNWSVHLTETVHELKAIDERFQFSLQLKPAKHFVIHGENGVSQKGGVAGQGSHYISFPRLATSGTLQLGSQQFRVSGDAWMDHEFFSSQLDPGLIGWDWFSIQFDNNTELMLFRLRRRDGGVDRYSAGTFIDANGKTTSLASSDLQLQPLRTWNTYPVEWRIAVPKLGIDIQATPRLDAQELVSKSSLTPTYWEGAMQFSGSHNGKGYLEMTGYRKEFRFLPTP
ncbi:lipocalin-like domain-containing protein [Bryobacter aggregatus]|uniref:lipocalin-like domain-containing protein n=1 Tax=Bryobacter aggregatus TaxID=360054 RepID=UPI0006897032|nr:lipocalin-like domain-containing protein [Bryobacter aggregatus]